jgi:hypothetical protein
VAFQWDGEKQDNLDIYVKALGPELRANQKLSDKIRVDANFCIADHPGVGQFAGGLV